MSGCPLSSRPWSAGSPYVNASSKDGYKGYNYQNKRRVTQNKHSKGSARGQALLA